MKICSKCKEQKPLDDFHKQRKSPDGHAWYCKACKCEQARQYRKTPAGIESRGREDRSRARYHQIKSRYGLDRDAYHDLIDGIHHCQICGNAFTGTEPVIDHCHATGNVRGLLCMACNSMLGYAKDNIQTLSSAIQYLKTTASSAGSNACGEEGAGRTRKSAVKPASVKQEASSRFSQK